MSPLSILFAPRRVLAASTPVSGTLCHPSQKKGLFLIAIDNQRLTKPCFRARSDESTIRLLGIDKFCIVFPEIWHEESADSTWSKSQHNVESWPTLHVVFENVLCSLSNSFMSSVKMLSCFFGKFSSRVGHNLPFPSPPRGGEWGGVSHTENRKVAFGEVKSEE